jgi:hypothetical protein
MQTFGLVILAMIGMTLIAGLSFGLYIVLPASMLERASHHGRHSGLGPRARQRTGSTGGAAVIDVDARLRQSA